MMWRLNFLVFWACLVLRNDYMLYYICPMHTLFTVFVYATLGIASRLNKSHAGIALKIGVVTALVVACWESKTIFYTIWTPFLWLVGYNDPRKPSDDLLHGAHAMAAAQLAAASAVAPRRHVNGTLACLDEMHLLVLSADLFLFGPRNRPRLQKCDGIQVIWTH